MIGLAIAEANLKYRVKDTADTSLLTMSGRRDLGSAGGTSKTDWTLRDQRQLVLRQAMEDVVLLVTTDIATAN